MGQAITAETAAATTIQGARRLLASGANRARTDCSPSNIVLVITGTPSVMLRIRAEKAKPAGGVDPGRT